jgi:small subunit ribosomal protein S17
MNKINEKIKRMLTGTVISTAANKTSKVKIERRVAHPVYGKIITLSSNLLVHDEGNMCKKGDVVSITSVRPISKNKTWELVEVISSAQTD